MLMIFYVTGKLFSRNIYLNIYFRSNNGVWKKNEIMEYY